MKYTIFTSLAMSTVLCLSLMNACSKQGPTDPVDTAESSFDLIQNRILTSSCAIPGCHASENDGSFAQHGLVLAKGKAYNNLFEIAPKNELARADGLKLVKAFNSLQSLFFHKVNPDNSHHGGKNYGSTMPLGNAPLYAGQIEFIRRWIEAGAPEKGNVVETSLLDDKTPSETTPFEVLAAPTAGMGYQMKLDKFDVAPKFERELFVRKPLGNTETAYINRIQIKMRPGSHHFILYGFRNPENLAPLNQVRDLRNADGSLNILTFQQMGNHIFNFGGSEANMDYTFPEGTAVAIAPNATFDMNSHYFNTGTSPIPGEVYINLYTTNKANVKNTLKVLDLANQNLNIPPKQKTVISKTFTFDKNIKVAMLFSHTHKLGEKFEILIKGGSRDGEVVYTSGDWEHPEKINYTPYISIKKGEGLTSRITYNNTTDKTVRFGLTTEDEMGIIFGYYFEE
ncbi:monooxygenase [Emticicia soli]|uniref:Copper type II ascorbate-dependent monooxygenase C-terminal domain-containing protein n=1 Tax=Emticicia soli TaxID=2027878 RepID=A0ABW5J7R6_9BACT